jgi:hypothetical protein
MNLIKTVDDAARLLSEGAASFVIDVAESVNEAAENYSPNELGVNYKRYADKTDLAQRYYKKKFAIENFVIAFEMRDFLRAALKFYPAIERAAMLADSLPTKKITIAFGDAPVSSLQHFFIANELRHAGVNFEALQIRAQGSDDHEAIARHFGYKLRDA